MINTHFYEAMFKRKSVRKYTSDFINDDILTEIKEFTNSVTMLDPTIKTEMKIVSREEIKSILPIKAPHYLMFYSEKKEGYLLNAGYMLQQIDLFLSMNKLGSCYLGMAHPTKETKDSSELDFVIVLAFGYALETIHRLSLAAFNRKSLGQIALNINDEHFQHLVESARVAPSANNSQPWFFVKDSEMIHVYRNKPNKIIALLIDKMNQLDMGIALYHMTLTLDHNNDTYAFVKHERGQEKTLKNQEYTITVALG